MYLLRVHDNLNDLQNSKTVHMFYIVKKNKHFLSMLLVAILWGQAWSVEGQTGICVYLFSGMLQSMGHKESDMTEQLNWTSLEILLEYNSSLWINTVRVRQSP